MSFNNVLIPVDFSESTEVAIKKAIEISDPDACKFHLIHVLTSPLWQIVSLKLSKEAKAIKKYEVSEIEKKLNQWKVTIEESMPNIEVYTWIIWGTNIQRCIIIKAKLLKANMIIIGKKINHSWLPILNTVTPSTIARMTGSAVLTAKIGSLNNHIRNVVVPVNETISQSKMDAIAGLCRKKRIKIFLITFINESNKPENFSASALLHIYQWIRSSMHCNVEYAVLHGRNKAKAIMEFSEKNQADVLLLNSNTETKVNWWGTHISDLLPTESKVQVLAV